MLTWSGCSSSFTGIPVFRFCPESLFRNSFVETHVFFSCGCWVVMTRMFAHVSFVLLFLCTVVNVTLLQWLSRNQSLCCLLLGSSAYKEYLPAALENLCFLLWCCDNYDCVPPLDGLLPRTRMFPVIVAENAECRIRQETLAGVLWQKMESVWINTARTPPNAASISFLRPNAKPERNPTCLALPFIKWVLVSL